MDSFSLSAHGHQLHGALGACVLVGVSCSVLWPTHLGVTADRFPRGGASMFALMAAAGNLGNIAAPWAEGFMAEQWDLCTALMIASASPFLFGILAVAILYFDSRATKEETWNSRLQTSQCVCPGSAQASQRTQPESPST